jgi:hypothetical protein
VNDVDSGNTIQQNPRRQGHEDDGDPSAPTWGKAHALHEIQDIVPSDYFEVFGDVLLDEEGRQTDSVKATRDVPDVHEIIMYAP